MRAAQGRKHRMVPSLPLLAIHPKPRRRRIVEMAGRLLSVNEGGPVLTEERGVVASRVGLHARPAAAFVQEAMKYRSKITVEASRKAADAKSIIQLLALGVKCGQEILVRADGPDEGEAVANLIALASKV